TAPAEDLIPQTTRALATLTTALATDSEALGAMARVSHHQGYRPPGVALGLTRSVLSYPQLGDVLNRTLALFHEPHSGLGPGPSYADFNTALDVLRGELTTTGPAPEADQRQGTTLDATTELLFSTDAALSTSRARLLVRRDRYGMPR